MAWDKESVAGWARGRLGLHPDGPRRSPKAPAGEGWHLPALWMLPWPQSWSRSCASPRHRPCWSPSVRKVNPIVAPAPRGDQRVPPKHPHGVTGLPDVTAPMETGNPCLNQQPLRQPCLLGDSSAPQHRLCSAGLGWFGDFLGFSSTMLSTPCLLVPKSQNGGIPPVALAVILIAPSGSEHPGPCSRDALTPSHMGPALLAQTVLLGLKG